MPLPLAFELPAFMLGLLFGSFLNVCISRLPQHQSLSKPRSHCPRCGHTIRWFDNIPLLSWLLLRARCRDCQQPISWRYPSVELAFGIWSAGIVTYLLRSCDGYRYFCSAGATVTVLQFVASALALALLGFLLIGLVVMDWQTHTLPDAFTFPGIALGFLLTCIQAAFLAPGEGDIKFDPQHSLRMSSPGSFVERGNVFLVGSEAMVLERALAIVAAACLLLAIRAIYKTVRHRDGLGLGDVKLLAMIAAFLGFWPAILALFAGVLLCCAYALTLLARRRAHALTRLPLGTFLSLGGLLAALLGTPILTWYRSLL